MSWQKGNSWRLYLEIQIINSMEIKRHVYCLFEQSGVFKNEFKKLGYDASDWDIQNNFGETDHQTDLFAEIERAYEGGQVSLTR